MRSTPRFAYLVLFCIGVMVNIADSRCDLGRRNLGVFFWATGSAMEGYLPPFSTLEANSSALETE